MTLAAVTAVQPTDTALLALRKALSVTVIAALADWLLWGHTIGIALALLLAAISIGVLVVNRTWQGFGRTVAAFAVAILALVPLVETISPLSLAAGILGTAMFALLVSGQLSERWPASLLEPVVLLLIGPYRAVADLAAIARAHGGRFGHGTMLLRWIVPIVFGAVFLALFAAANPMIANGLAAIDWNTITALFDPARMLFWLAMTLGAWGIVCVRSVASWFERAPVPPPIAPTDATAPSHALSELFGTGAILRSLILFNLLFAVQTALDLTYLWRGVALPYGLTYADYAHRGAYPLMVTAALAAAFVVVTFGPGSTLEKSWTARALVFAWIGQNVALVASSILRLDLYVGVYSLSYWRMAAFIWMGLVACGLLLICARILFARSNTWLTGANLAAALAMLYACCFINFAAVIATYNVTHSQEVLGVGNPLDIPYLAGLGPDAIPALDRFIETLPKRLDGEAHRPVHWRRFDALSHRNTQAGVVRNAPQDWRAWTYRSHRLATYLSTRADPN